MPRIQRTALQPCPEPVANEPICSVSESLAHGLVKRLSSESRAANLATVQAAGIPVLPTKQAAAFRAACRWLDTTIPAALKIARVRIGDARGKHKDSLFGILHWLPREDTRSLVASCLLIEARKLTPTYTDLLEVSGHALMRLFYRLKTTDAAIVLAELSAGVLAFNQWAQVLYHLPAGCDILVPTPGGVLAVAANGIPGSTESVFVARTWMSHSRLEDNAARLDAAKRALDERGIVLNLWPFPLLSPSRIDAMREQTQATGLELLNRVLESQLPPGRRLPADWRFH